MAICINLTCTPVVNKVTECRLAESVVLSLCKTLSESFCHVYFDSFYTSPSLLLQLLDKGIHTIGTVRSNRKNMPKSLPDDKSMQRGDSVGLYANGISAVKWMDTRSVIHLSNMHDPNATGSDIRREKRRSQKIRLLCPTVVTDYNAHMGVATS